MRPAPALVAVLLLLALPPTAGTAAEDDDARVARAMAWLAAQQRADGTWDLLTQGYPAEAAASAGLDPKEWPTRERSAHAALHPSPCTHLVNPRDRQDCVYKSWLRVAHAAGVSGYDPRALNGKDAVQAARDGFVAGQSGDAAYVNDDVWAILALRAAGVRADDPQVRASVEVLLRARAGDGGWSHLSVAGSSRTDMTGMALAALRAAGEPVPDAARARAYLLAQLDREKHGFRSGDPNGGANCQSTVWALHGLAVLGGFDEREALGYLRGLQNPDGGFSISGAGPSDVFCTTEAVVILAGWRYPLPSYASADDMLPERAHAREPVALRASPPFEALRVAWRTPGVAGADGTYEFPAAGPYHLSWLAEGPGVRHRGSATLHVLGARPRLPELPAEVAALRHEPVVVDASAAHDPDGAVAALRVEWGDGNLTEGADLAPSHAYALPGEYRVNVTARDGDGHRSDPRSLVVRVRNQPPAFGALPGRLVADRATPLALSADASDPEGDPLALSWSLGDASGAGAVDVVPSVLGNHTLSLMAADPHGGVARANVTVEVVNLPPVLANLTLPTSARPGEPLALRVDARDPDGPAPDVRWRVGGATFAGASVEVALPEGEHEVEATATDADGAARSLRTTLVVAAEPAARVAPTVDALEGALAEGVLRVRVAASPPGAVLTLRWWSDAGSGDREIAPGEHDVALPGATEARVEVEARHDGLLAAREAGPFRAAAAPPLAPPALEPVARLVAGEPARLRAEVVEGAATYRFDFGDGNATAWLDAPEASHAWERPGRYDVRLTARAADGRESIASRTTLVSAPPPAAPRAEEPLAPASVEPPEAEEVVTAARPPEEARPAPGAPWWALLLAPILRRGRRAASA